MNDMLFSDMFASATEALARNKLRSVLTTLGIIIGVGSVVLMVSIGASFERYIFDQLEGISAGTIDIYPKGIERLGGTLDTLSFDDGDAIERLSTVTNVARSIFIAEPVRYGREEESPFTLGTEPGFYRNYGIIADRGRLITDDDVKGARNVAVIGPDTVDELFNNEDPIGKRITIAGRKFTVIGTTEPLGSLVGNDIDKMVTVPFTVAKAVTGQQYLSYVTVEAVDSVDLAIADIKSLLRERHDIENPDDDPDKDDFLARGAEQATEILGTVTLSLTLFLGLVAGISLLVGGIGIMNIMLVSVSERTREIGLRKAVGARRGDVLKQFLIEAVLLTMIGGFIGICGGVALAYMAALVADSFIGDFPFAVSWTAVFASTLMALGTGLGFGLYPAKKAADLSPMEALRWE